MVDIPAPDEFDAAPMSLLVAADLQDNLLSATHDLERLQTLLAHACDELMGGFHGAVGHIREAASGLDPDDQANVLFDSVHRHLGAAITALRADQTGG